MSRKLFFDGEALNIDGGRLNLYGEMLNLHGMTLIFDGEPGDVPLLQFKYWC